MAVSKTIKTKRLIIEPFSEKHLTTRYVAWLNNLDTVRYSEQRFKKHSLQTCQKYLATFRNSPHYFWAIRVKNGNLGHIGNMNAYVDTINRTADLGILIGEKEATRGKGFATEAWKAVSKYLFRAEKLRKITAGAISENKPMLKLMKRVGMVNDGKRRRHFLWNGKETDVIYMAFFKKNLGEPKR